MFNLFSDKIDDAMQGEVINKDDVRGAETTWDKKDGKYNIGKFAYPIDVTSSPDMQHCIVFYINVRSTSGKPENTIGRVDKTMDPSIGGAAVGATAAGTVMGAVTSGFKALSGAAIAKRIAGNKSKTGAGAAPNIGAEAAKGALKGGGAGAAAGGGAMLVSAAMGSSQMYRLKDAITLAVQEPMKTSYKMNYDENYDMGTMFGITGAVSLAEAGLAGLVNLLKTPAVVGAPDFGKAIQKDSGKAINPFKTVLFESVSLREFRFKYKFMPKSAKEAQNVLDIINTFKFHMHPEFSSGKIFLIHPAEFNIAYYYKGKENTTWNKISTCVLTDMTLDAGAEQLAYFQDGMSAEINMELRFLETEALTKERIKEGF